MDPDQEFDPADPAGTTTHEIMINGCCVPQDRPPTPRISSFLGPSTSTTTCTTPWSEEVAISTSGGLRGDSLGGAGRRHLHPLCAWLADDRDRCGIQPPHLACAVGSRLEDPWRSAQRVRRQKHWGPSKADGPVAIWQYLGAMSRTGETLLGYTLVGGQRALTAFLLACHEGAEVPDTGARASLQCCESAQAQSLHLLPRSRRRQLGVAQSRGDAPRDPVR